MNGIIVDDFELALKKINNAIEDVKNDIADINESYSLLKKDFPSDDLRFLINKLNTQINQFKNEIAKIDAYKITLSNVLISYKGEYEALIDSIDKLKP